MDEGEASTNDQVYTPQVKDDLKPIKNKEFETLNDVAEFYNRYAKDAGFSIRHHSTKLNKDRSIQRKEIVCYKEGNSKVEGKKRKRGAPKLGCKAKIAVVRRKESGRYAISKFVEGHNHPLTSPPRVHLLRSHRRVSKLHALLSQQMSLVNVRKHKQFQFLGVQAGGIENIGCTQRDLYNRGRDLRRETKGLDGDMLYMYFETEQKKDSSFFYTMESDEENRVKCCFWADGSSRRAYEFYGDVVVFDTTYNTNRYGLIFAPFTGVNNHGQTIIFACGFLSDEKSDSFIWLFNQFLSAMPGNAPNNAPKMIITDQDPAMKLAISEALPQTFHRYCSWHILDKFSAKLAYVKYRDYYNEFYTCIWNSTTGDEFDSRWNEIMNKSGLSGNPWLQSIYEIRSSWVPAHVNHIFSAGMSSSQRAESQHAFFKDYVSKWNTLVDFMYQFKRGLLHQRSKELEEDHKNIEEKAKTSMSLEIEDDMAKVYTRKYFYQVQEQLKESFKYKLEIVTENTTHCVYKVTRKNIDTCATRELTYEKDKNFASCSCRKFESEGLPCRHVLSYLVKVQDVDKLPTQYILKRWTQSARQGVVLDSHGVEIKDNKDLLARRAKLFQYATDAIDQAMVSDETSQLFIDALDSFSEKAKTMVGSENIPSTVVLEEKNYTSVHKFNEPKQVRAKGCGRRLKEAKESKKAKVKETGGRLCHGCGLKGQSHDKRNCPEVKKTSPASEEVTQSSSTSMDDDSSE